MNEPRGILAFGAYLPRRRLQRSAIFAANRWFAPELEGLARGEKAVANWDEDSITMGVEAARDCLAGVDRDAVHSLTLASTTLPFADRSNAGVVKQALNLRDAVATLDSTGSQRAGTAALSQLLNGSTTGLCIAAERRLARAASAAELGYGDGAAALLVGTGDVVAATLGTHSVSVDFVDHFRATGADFDYAWESRWLRDEGYGKVLGAAIADGLVSLGLDGADVDHAVIDAPLRGVPARLAKQCGIAVTAVADPLAESVGHTGSAHPLLLLAATLENAKPGEKILVAGFGQGADVFVFETTDALGRLEKRKAVSGHLATGVADDNYLRYLFHRGIVDVERGMRAELDQKQPGTTLYRNRKSVLGLLGGRSRTSGAVQFPKSPIGLGAGGAERETFEDYPLADRVARVVTCTADRLTWSPDPPSWYGIVDFDGGGRLVAEFTDVEPGELEVGREMRMVFRIKAVDEKRRFTKYFWKATPDRQESS